MKFLKVVFIIAHVNKSLQMEWMFEKLMGRNIEQIFILLGSPNTELRNFLLAKNFEVYEVPLKGPVSLVLAFFRTVFLLLKIKPAVVHTHLYHANIVGIIAGWCVRIKKRIQTRHHASIHHQYFRKAVYVDRLINGLCTDIVLPSKSLQEVVVDREGANPKKIHYIPHGFELRYFSVQDNNAVDQLKRKYNLLNKYPIIGVIARFTEWKGIQYVIPAFKEILKEYPDGHLVLANADGDFKDEIFSMLQLVPSNHYTVVKFENDLASLYHCFDFFIHVPVDPVCEAFGQTYVEALASGIPSVFTLSGIAADFIRDGENALVAEYRDDKSIANLLRALLEDPAWALRLRENGLRSVQRFDVSVMSVLLEELYRSKQT